MRFNFYQNLNPAIKVLGAVLFAFGLPYVSSLQLNASVLLISMILIMSIPECRKLLFLLGVLLCSFLAAYGIYQYFGIKRGFYIGDYNYATIYSSLKWSSYVGILYLHYSGIKRSVMLLPFCEALHQSFHLPKVFTHWLYRIMLFISQYRAEAKTVVKVYKAKGVSVSSISIRVLKTVLKNLKRKLTEAEIALQAKGFDAQTPSSHYETYALEVGDALYLVSIILSMAIVVNYKIW